MGTTQELENALNALGPKLGGTDGRVSDLKRLSGGASQETWAFDFGPDKGPVEELILRRAPGGVSAARSQAAIGLENEAALIDRAVAAGVPAPRVIHSCEPQDGLGQAFIMNRIAGETIARKILRDDEYATARQKLAAQCGSAAALIHSIDIADVPELPRSMGEDQLAQYEEIYRGFETPRPVFELAIQWLKASVPEAVEPSLVHGDFRLGNLIVDETGLVAVLDWELAHLGDRREDLAWICINSWRFGNSENRVGGFGALGDFLDAYAAAGGVEVTPAEIDWWETLGSFKWGVMCMIMYEAFRSGADPSVERAAIGRRVSETEIDLINLLERVRDA
ncbi:MAG: phosphotransferase family protein [Pseudomonadota bacterium]